MLFWDFSMNYTDTIGVIGVTITLAAYFLMILKLISSNGRIYFFMNFAGAAIACYSSVLIAYFPFVILEGTWSAISLVALINTWKFSSRK